MSYDVKILIRAKGDKQIELQPTVLSFSVYKNPIEKLSNVYIISFILNYADANLLMELYKKKNQIRILYSIFEVEKDKRDLRKVTKKEISRNELIIKSLISGKYLGDLNERVMFNVVCNSVVSEYLSISSPNRRVYSFQNGAQFLAKEISMEYRTYSHQVETPPFENVILSPIDRGVNYDYFPVYFIEKIPDRYLVYDVIIPTNVSILESLNFVNRKYKITYYPTFFFYDDFDFVFGRRIKDRTLTGDTLKGISLFPIINGAVKKKFEFGKIIFKRYLGNLLKSLKTLTNISSIDFYFSDESGAFEYSKEKIKNPFSDLINKTVQTNFPDDISIFEERISKNMEKLSSTNFYFYEIEDAPLNFFDIGIVYSIKNNQTYYNLLSLVHNFILSKTEYGAGFILNSDLLFQEIQT